MFVMMLILFQVFFAAGMRNIYPTKAVTKEGLNVCCNAYFFHVFFAAGMNKNKHHNQNLALHILSEL